MIRHRPAGDARARARHRTATHVAILALLGAAIAAPAVAGAGSPAAEAKPPVGARLALPVPGAPRVQRAFERPPAPWAAGHRGVDLTAVAGADVLAPGDGIVTFAGRVAGRPVVTIAHPGGYRSSLEPVAPDVAQGDRVHRGDVIGALASRGWHCTSSCLHWGVRVGRGAATRYVDPMTLIVRDAPIVLLPDDARSAPS